MDGYIYQSLSTFLRRRLRISTYIFVEIVAWKEWQGHDFKLYVSWCFYSCILVCTSIAKAISSWLSVNEVYIVAKQLDALGSVVTQLYPVIMQVHISIAHQSNSIKNINSMSREDEIL